MLFECQRRLIWRDSRNRRSCYSQQVPHLSYKNWLAVQSTHNASSPYLTAPLPREVFDTFHRLSHLSGKYRPGQFTAPNGRFDNIHTNIVGPLPLYQGYKYLVTMIDRFSRWPEIVQRRTARLYTVDIKIRSS